MKRKIRMGMVGGGPGSFIGGVHRAAARLDGQIELVCGAFSQDPAKSKAMAAELFLPKARCYDNYAQMFARERALPAGERMDFVTIATPNVTHFPIAMQALDCGFHVVCDKPITFSLAEARKLRDKVRKTRLLFCLTHNYSAYPMIRQAKALIAKGKLGKVRKIVAEYDLGWLAAANAGKQAVWRVDPKRSGVSACVGDIGTHAEHLIEFVTGLKITEVCADLSTFVIGRSLDDDGTVMLRFNNGARGFIAVSEVASGEENQFKIRIYGSEGSLEWHQMNPENLIYRSNTQAMRIYRRSWAEQEPGIAALTRLPAGHPEGFIEAFANIYTNFAKAVDARLERKAFKPDYPTVDEGVREMAFVETVVKNSRGSRKWSKLPA
ncbi:MAG: Gfo/Idh/MocA family oxidoreductase [Kiritimatiellae bacterium]|nr:Gfo/Idh/MocA family oxidoreductase [Kiritimatiellia bacterium]